MLGLQTVSFQLGHPKSAMYLTIKRTCPAFECVNATIGLSKVTSWPVGFPFPKVSATFLFVTSRKALVQHSIQQEATAIFPKRFHSFFFWSLSARKRTKIPPEHTIIRTLWLRNAISESQVKVNKYVLL
jgi:hypothetical protein